MIAMTIAPLYAYLVEIWQIQVDMCCVGVNEQANPDRLRNKARPAEPEKTAPVDGWGKMDGWMGWMKYYTSSLHCSFETGIVSDG